MPSDKTNKNGDSDAVATHPLFCLFCLRALYTIILECLYHCTICIKNNAKFLYMRI